jgi:hypothetical protein
LSGSIPRVLPIAFLFSPQDLVSAAAGLAGAVVLIGLFLVSINGS